MIGNAETATSKKSVLSWIEEYNNNLSGLSTIRLDFSYAFAMTNILDS